MRYEELMQTPLKHILVTKSLDGFEECWEAIEKECSDIVSFYREHKKVFYRGTRRGELFFKGVPREDRKPLDTPQVVHDALEGWLKEHGFAARRSNSLFITSDVSVTHHYGQPFVIFPKNGFQYTWFEKSRDLFDELNLFMKTELRQMDNIKNDHVAVKFPPHVNEFMERVQPRNDSLVTPLMRQLEVMITGTEYCAVKKTGLGNVLDILLDIQEPPKDKAPGPWG